eukprot:363234-Chlamydomonas_euryale.AAC.5
MLVEWWDKRGRRWVNDFERLNPLMKVRKEKEIKALPTKGGDGVHVLKAGALLQQQARGV